MELERRDEGQVSVVRLRADRLDAAIAVRFKEAFREAARGARPRVLLDMGEVDFMDSSGLGAVVAIYKLLGAEHSFELAGLSPGVDRVFRLTRMDSVFTIHADVAAALAGAGGGAGGADARKTA